MEAGGSGRNEATTSVILKKTVPSYTLESPNDTSIRARLDHILGHARDLEGGRDLGLALLKKIDQLCGAIT